MNKVIYINNDGIFNINKDETLEIYHYVVDKSINVIINLNGENAKVIYHLNVISNNDNTCKVDVNHLSSNTESKIICHGVNIGDKKLEFNVTGLVPKDMVKCICNQENQIINLKNGESVIKPNLLIRNYDTFSNHAAYIGEFSKDRMFYLKSRGISEKNAIKLLMEGLLLGNGDRGNVIVKEFMNSLKEAYNG